MSDILERLKGWASIQADGSQIGADLREAVAEIERLRALAGAVSAGPSLAEIKTERAG